MRSQNELEDYMRENIKKLQENERNKRKVKLTSRSLNIRRIEVKLQNSLN